MSRRASWRASLTVAGAALAAGLRGAAAQDDDDERLIGTPTAEVHFARLVYRDSPTSRRGRFGFRGGGGAWATDYADAEFHLMQGVGRLTRVDAAPVDIDGNGGRLIRLDDDRVFDYPWLYAVEVGQWYLTEDEAALLREYLDRGGFLMVDDFWGEYEWSIFTDSMRRVFPDRPIQELGEDHELLHVLYDLDQRTQIPGRGGQRLLAAATPLGRRQQPGVRRGRRRHLLRRQDLHPPPRRRHRLHLARVRGLRRPS